jgi:hypothetical protein
MIEAFRTGATEAKLLLWLIDVNVYDFLSTKLIVGLTGPEGEANPAMRWVIEHYSIWGILGFKMFAILIFLGAYALATPESRVLRTKTVTYVLIFLCTLLSIVCVWNTWVAYNVLTV